jgi:hypothetical protein
VRIEIEIGIGIGIGSIGEAVDNDPDPDPDFDFDFDAHVSSAWGKASLDSGMILARIAGARGLDQPPSAPSRTTMLRAPRRSRSVPMSA